MVCIKFNFSLFSLIIITTFLNYLNSLLSISATFLTCFDFNLVVRISTVVSRSLLLMDYISSLKTNSFGGSPALRPTVFGPAVESPLGLTTRLFFTNQTHGHLGPCSLATRWICIQSMSSACQMFISPHNDGPPCTSDPFFIPNGRK